MTLAQAFQIGLQHHRAGRLAEAESCYRQILAVEASHPDALHHLGIVAFQVGKLDDAGALIRQAIAAQPGAQFRMDLGNVLSAQGRQAEAIAEYREFLTAHPNYAPALSNLGATLRAVGQMEEAAVACRRAVELQPNLAQAHNNLALVLKQQGALDGAVAAYRRALQLQPQYAEATSNLGVALREQGLLGDAAESFCTALKLSPRAPGILSNLICTLYYLPGVPPAEIAEECRRWQRQFAEPLKATHRRHANERSPRRRLRIGYVSPDLREHVVGRNLLPLFKQHDHREFEVFCYASLPQPDALTAEFQRRSDVWRDAAALSDDALAETIRADAIDILVDLSQHTAGNRLLVFARQPAPVQVSFAGYPASTGLEAIGHRLSDRHLEAGSANQRERVHLLESFWCYDPDGADVPVSDLPARASGFVTVGCLNNFCKVNEPTLRLWAKVLSAVPDSRLVLLSHPGTHRDRTLQVLEKAGVERQRIEFVPPRPRPEYLALYQQIDIVLDTFPYNGHTTSLDAFWMGVPVVSLAGESTVSRAGLSMATNLGLPELTAATPEDFVHAAVQFAANLDRLAELRSTLRQRMERSPLLGAAGFTRQIEEAYRTMWQDWCRGGPALQAVS